MNRRSFLTAGGLCAVSLPALPFQEEKSKLKIIGVRIVQTRPKRPVASYTPAPGSWSTSGFEVANPMSIYPEYKAKRSLWNPDPGKLGTFTVEVTTDKGLKGYGSGGAGGAEIIEQHLVKLLIGQDPFDIERLWDVMYRSTMPYGQAGVAINAIGGGDLALWDLVGNALGVPVYKLLGGATKTRIPSYCTGNDIAQHLKFGYKRLKLAMAHGPADGYIGQMKNVELVKRTRGDARSAAGCGESQWASLRSDEHGRRRSAGDARSDSRRTTR